MNLDLGSVMEIKVKELDKNKAKEYNNSTRLFSIEDEYKNTLQLVGFGKNTRKDFYRFELKYNEKFTDIDYFNEAFNFLRMKCNKQTFSCVVYKDNDIAIPNNIIELGFYDLDNCYSYLDFAIIYEITDLVDGKYYIGLSQNRNSWESGYMGSSTSIWKNHINKHPNIEYNPESDNAHSYKREIIETGFRCPDDLFEAEVEWINKHIEDELCCNVMNWKQSSYLQHEHIDIVCPECGGIKGAHKKSCSKYAERKQCPECGGSRNHYKTCSHYKGVEPCPECGGVFSHYSFCKYFSRKQQKELERCPECGGTFSAHKKTCSQFKTRDSCPECGGKGGHHYKECSRYKAHTKADPCPECGVVYGHKKTCSKAIKCPECGASQGKHTKNCSHYEEIICPECGGKSYNHKKTCSHYKDRIKPCPECGGLRGHHRIGCSQYTPDGLAEPCPECGSRKGHKKTCSHAKKCSECGCTHGKHKTTCSHYKDPGKCPECGYSLQSRRHAKACSHYKAPKAAAPCPECGGTRGHFKTCSKYKQSKKVCGECGGIAGNHKSFCSKRKKSEPCPECGDRKSVV